MRRLALLLLLTGCAESGPSGPPPKFPAARPMTLQLDVSGNDRAEFDAYLEWMLKDNGMVRRAAAGADARLAVEANLQRDTAILAGTDLVLTVRLHGDTFDERKTWSRTGLTSNVPSELDRLTTEAVIWTLSRAAGAGASAAVAPPVETAPAISAQVETPVPEEPASAPATRKKKRRR